MNSKGQVDTSKMGMNMVNSFDYVPKLYPNGLKHGKFNRLSGQVVPKMGMSMHGGFKQLSG
jgi:hypothetical protein